VFGKQENVSQFYSCQGNVRDFSQNQENVRKNFQWVNYPKTSPKIASACFLVSLTEYSMLIILCCFITEFC